MRFKMSGRPDLTNLLLSQTLDGKLPESYEGKRPYRTHRETGKGGWANWGMATVTRRSTESTDV